MVVGRSVRKYLEDGSEGPPAEGFHLTYDQGKAVQEILLRYLHEELEPDQKALFRVGDMEDSHDQLTKDIEYIEGLAKLFD
jgi:hypothetical protein